MALAVLLLLVVVLAGCGPRTRVGGMTEGKEPSTSRPKET